MGLPSSPPRYASWAELVAPIRRGETGWRPYALQVALTSLGRTLVADGVFGPATEEAVVDFQRGSRLYRDGIAGVATQAKAIERLGAITHERLPDVPDGLMRGFAEGEGANALAATNWSVPGGVDCGPMQFRVYGPPYDQAAMKRAFDTLAAMVAAGKDVLKRTDDFYTRTWVRQQARRRELALRLAVLAHNWPAGASAWASNGSCSSPNAVAEWAPASAKFPDGKPVRTRREWCEFYAMGGSHGEGAITKYVRDWS